MRERYPIKHFYLVTICYMICIAITYLYIQTFGSPFGKGDLSFWLGIEIIPFLVLSVLFILNSILGQEMTPLPLSAVLLWLFGRKGSSTEVGASSNSSCDSGGGQSCE